MKGVVAVEEAKHACWLPDVILALRELGGEASLNDIYRKMLTQRGQREGLPPEWRSAVRATIYAHSSDAKAYVPGNPDVFCRACRGV